MRLKKQIFFILSCFLLIISFSIPTYALESKSQVSYNVSKDSIYKVVVNASGPGTIHYGDEKIRDGTRNIDLRIGEILVLRLTPDKNSNIKTVVLNGKNILNELTKYQNEYILKVSGISKTSNLNVKFESKTNNDINISSDNEPSNNKKSKVLFLPKTGETSELPYILGLIGSLGILVAFYALKRRNKK